MCGPSSPVAPVVEDLTARLKKLEQSAAQAPAARPDAGALKGVTDQLAQANERIAKLEGANRQLAALSEAQTKLVETTRALETRIGEGAPAEAAGRIAKLEEIDPGARRHGAGAAGTPTAGDGAHQHQARRDRNGRRGACAKAAAAAKRPRRSRRALRKPAKPKRR